MAKLPEIEEFAKKVSDLALDEFEYEGKTIREWTELILNGNLTEVVRCKDCKHIMFSDCYGECGKGHMSIVSPDDFCSYGELKDGYVNG